MEYSGFRVKNEEVFSFQGEFYGVFCIRGGGGGGGVNPQQLLLSL